MKAITPKNYELFFLDYIEGRLSAGQAAALMEFLDENPALKEELQGLELITLKPDVNIRYGGRESLKKPVILPYGALNESNYEEIFAALAEGDLPEAVRAEVKIFIGLNPHLKGELELLRQCRLQPNTEILFSGKSSLKKPATLPRLTRRLYYGIAVAASLALLIGLFFLFNPQPVHYQIIAEVESEPVARPKDTTPTGSGEQAEETSNTVIQDSQRDFSTGNQQLAVPENIASDFNSTEGENRNMITPGRLAPITIPFEIPGAKVPKPAINEQKYFSGYFTDIAKAQNIRHSETPEEQLSSKGLLAQGTAILKEIMQPGEENFQILPEQIDLWKIADAGINGFARLTSADLEFRKTTDNQGRVTAFAFESQPLVINRSLRKMR